MTLIFMLSSRHGGAGSGQRSWLFRMVNVVPGVSDKVVHAGEYGGLGALCTRAIGRPVWAWIIAAFYGITDEIHQSFVPGREADPRDWVADLIGSGIGVYVTYWLSRRAAAGNGNERIVIDAR